MSDTITPETYAQSQPDRAGVHSVTFRYAKRSPVVPTYEASIRSPDPAVDAKARLVLLRALAADRERLLPLYQRESTQADKDARHAVYLTQLGEMPKG